VGFMAILFLIIAIVLYLYGPKHEGIKWLLVFLIIGCMGDLSHWISESIWYPLLHLINEIGSPYTLFMFSIVRSELIKSHIVKILTYALILPMMITAFLTLMNPQLELDYRVLVVWVVPYYLTACFLLFFSYFKEINPKKKTRRLMTACIVVPLTLIYMVEDILVKALGYHLDMYWLAFYSSMITFVLFVVFVFRVGAFGVRVKFEKQLLGQTITSIASGTTMLNHVFKNRLTNIDMLTSRLQEIAKLQQHTQMESDLELIVSETGLMMQTVKRIQKQIEDIVIVESVTDLVNIMEEALHSCGLLLEKKRIQVITEYTTNIKLRCDKLHLQEVFNNLIRNAVDAIDRELGQITIKIYENMKGALIDFTDNGKGITKDNANKIFDPFFSTKYREENFGLGLSYCYLVMQKHDGSIELVRNKEIGTTFNLFLPVSRIVS
jgi:two-component system NtrC family sensor kinase